MPLPPSRHPARALSLLILSGAGLLAGCGAPPAPAPPPPPAAPTVVIPSPVPLPTLPPPPPAGDGFSEDRPVACDGEPDTDEILDLLRDEGLLESGQQATVSDGPLCAGTWQYAVITVPELDPLQVVTEGEPGELELVTAGTDVCTVEVRVQAPAGIRVAANCAG